MTKEEIKERFREFTKSFDQPQSDALWQKQSNRFRDFWNQKIMLKEGGSLTDEEIDEIILILDRNAKGANSQIKSVAKMMIPQNVWRKMFKNLQSDSILASAVDSVFRSKKDGDRVTAINRLYEINRDNKNRLTGKSGNGISGLLAAHDPTENSFMVSLKARERAIPFFGFSLPNGYEGMSIGARIVKSNRVLVDGFSEIGINGSQRTISEFCYQDSLKELWNLSEHDGDDEADADNTSRGEKQCYWIYAPGSNADKWEEFYSKGIMAIGWTRLGDLNSYASKEDIAKRLQVLSNDSSSHKNDAITCWSFCHELKVGDIVIPKKGRSKYLGYGVIDSEYIYDGSLADFKNRRMVKWIKKGEWNSTDDIVLKTLTNITSNKAYVMQLKNLLDIQEQSMDIEKTLRQFLDQAKTYDLKTSNYPRSYNGLTLKVSFGAGNQSKVPWIGFTNDFNSISNGIYPVLLYYKRIRTLILAYGVSDTSSPARIWPKYSALTTIDEWFKEKRNEKADRYGESYVKSVYQIDGSQNYDRIESDLNELITEYKDIFASMVAEPIGNYERTEIPFSREDILKEIFLDEKEIDSIIALLQRKKNIILQGPPGVGKTFVGRRLAYLMMNSRNDFFVEMIQFHQSYSYEDFIQGYRPTESGGFDLRNGVFYQFCQKAKQNPDQPFFFIIDEINRGNLSKIFGELMMLVECDKRGPEFEIPLTYSRTNDERFHIPSNLHIIGTMNTADRSLALVDFALRRRFAFVALKPCFNSSFVSHLKTNKAPEKTIVKIISKIERLNTAIKEDRNLGLGFQVGHSYFTSVGPVADVDFQSIVESEIVPLLKEYWFDDEPKVLRLIEDLLA